MVWQRQAFVAGILLSSIGCQRNDTLLALPNRSQTAMLRDVAVGKTARIVCVTATLSAPCSRKTADIYVEARGAAPELTVRWHHDDSVSVSVLRGSVIRMKHSVNVGSEVIKIIYVSSRLNEQEPVRV